MAVYRVYCREGRYKAVPIRRIDFRALLLGPIWLVFQRAYLEALATFLLLIGLWGCGLPLFVAIIVVNILVNYVNLVVLDSRLQRSGWDYISSVEAEDPQKAIKSVLDPFWSLKKGVE